MITISELNNIVNQHKCNNISPTFWDEKEKCKQICYDSLTTNAQVGIKNAELIIPNTEEDYKYWDFAINELRKEGFNIQVNKQFKEYNKIFIWYL